METILERTSPTTDGPETVSCDHCGHLIGVYEPLVMADHGQARETSRAAEGRLPLVDTAYYHRACYSDR